MPLSYKEIKARKEVDPEYAARQKAYAVKYRTQNLEKERERQRIVKAKLREKDRDGYNAKMRLYNKENVYPKRKEERNKANPDHLERVSTRSQLSKSDYWRHWKMKSAYGIGIFEYRKMYEAQKGKCLICEEIKPDSGKTGLVVDHCHTKGHIRGLLCGKCNTGLGQFKDDVSLLLKAIEYLNEN